MKWPLRKPPKTGTGAQLARNPKNLGLVQNLGRKNSTLPGSPLRPYWVGGVGVRNTGANKAVLFMF
jgi:hypothetical protein